MYFPEWNDWFEWTSEVYTPVNVRNLFIGLPNNYHKLYRWPVAETFQDAGTSYQWLTQFKLPGDGSRTKIMDAYGVEADTARSANEVNVQFSDDDGESWTASTAIDLTQSRKLATRGGGYRERFVRLSGTTSTEVRLHRFVARIR